MEEELKSCPFCGCEGIRNKCNSFLFMFEHKEGCYFHGVFTILTGVNGDEDKIKAWNTRPTLKIPKERKINYYENDLGAGWMDGHNWAIEKFKELNKDDEFEEV